MKMPRYKLLTIMALDDDKEVLFAFDFLWHLCACLY